VTAWPGFPCNASLAVLKDFCVHQSEWSLWGGCNASDKFPGFWDRDPVVDDMKYMMARFVTRAIEIAHALTLHAIDETLEMLLSAQWTEYV